ncbi:MAG: cysteine methyltransferase [Planctomycetes bacterium B3_Pla]|nr:MAG: cysteine methyltransferase [Planctomycetes bacterium B3_Pla]
MQKVAKYVIFPTKWGHFGLAGTESALCRTCLPGPRSGRIKSQLLKNLSAAQFDKTFFKDVQEQVAAYFEGARIDFSLDIPVLLDGFSTFGRSVLTTCRKIKPGRTASYGALAKKIDRPAASRAVGSTLAKNPLPLIIPCHRVLRTDGNLGGFSAPGGIVLKERMLELEHQALSSAKMPNYV